MSESQDNDLNAPDSIVDAQVVSEQKDPPAEHPSQQKPWLFKPGQSGNPKGRPKLGDSMAELYRERLELIPPMELELAKRTGRAPRLLREIIVERLEAEIMKGNVKAIEQLLNRAFGKPKATVTVQGAVEHNVNTGPSEATLEIIARLQAMREQKLLKAGS